MELLSTESPYAKCFCVIWKWLFVFGRVSNQCFVLTWKWACVLAQKESIDCFCLNAWDRRCLCFYFSLAFCYYWNLPIWAKYPVKLNGEWKQDLLLSSQIHYFTTVEIKENYLELIIKTRNRNSGIRFIFK